ncbi:hypothetical protein AAG747_08500 [Rapidithrix thailandica]|uniref:Lipoprotein n=1 Tax=Rapidithrix thailandica TaxID=413964 RepID=A0AAW9SAL5_9BACT
MKLFPKQLTSIVLFAFLVSITSTGCVKRKHKFAKQKYQTLDQHTGIPKKLSRKVKTD